MASQEDRQDYQDEAYPGDYGDNPGYIPRFRQQMDKSMLETHLDSKDIIHHIKKMLEGFEFDDQTKAWTKSMMKVFDPQQNKIIEVEEGPLMDPKTIRLTVNYLQSFLNSNTYLSRSEPEMINNIMWDVNKRLVFLFHKLRDKIPSHVRMLLKSSVEVAIYHALNRAGDKITLDAATKMQQSVEHIQRGHANSEAEKREFKMLGI